MRLVQETVCPGHAGVIHKNVVLVSKKHYEEAEELVGGLAVNWQNAVIQVYSLSSCPSQVHSVNLAVILKPLLQEWEA